ncbi:MAG: hypothetical protein ABEJ25_04235 [Candidatus Bipolaricaulia bacterium]
MLESEAEIGNSDFHAGEIACGFIEWSPEDAIQYLTKEQADRILQYL